MEADRIITLKDRACVTVRGEDWRGFLQGLLTNDVEALAVGEARFAALLTPQGRVLYDLFVVAEEGGALLDVEAEWREALIARLTMYRLRAKVEIAASDLPISAYPRAGGDPASRADGPPPSRGQSEVWVADPRLPELGWRGYGMDGDENPAAYETHRLTLGVPGPNDWGTDKTYPIEANFDLLNGIDFAKGCFVGQETTSRMKRRGSIKSRMLPIAFEGPPPPPGTEILAGTLRAGEVLSGMEGRAVALVRLDRIEGAELAAVGRAVRVDWPNWLPR